MGVVKWGMSQAASDAWLAAGYDCARLGQTIGNAVLSAGTHEQDGIDAFGNPYSAAVDISVMHPTHIDDATVRAMCDDLFAHGFWPFARLPWHPDDGWLQVPHVHAIYLAERMKAPLQGQVHSGFAGRNGLVGEGVYHFWQPSDAEAVARNRELFLRFNPV